MYHVKKQARVRVGLGYAIWISPAFAIEVMDWTSRLISGDLSLLHELFEYHETVNVGTRVKATVCRHRPRRT